MSLVSLEDGRTLSVFDNKVPVFVANRLPRGVESGPESWRQNVSRARNLTKAIGYHCTHARQRYKSGFRVIRFAAHCKRLIKIITIGLGLS